MGMVTRVLSTGGGGGEASPPKCKSSPPNIFIRFGKTLLSNSHTLAINFLSAINKVQVQNCVIGWVLIEVASAIKFLIIVFHSLATCGFTNNQRNGGWHFEPPSYLLSFSLLLKTWSLSVFCISNFQLINFVIKKGSTSKLRAGGGTHPSRTHPLGQLTQPLKLASPQNYFF